MTHDEEAYFERYFDLFATEGWKQFIGEMQEVEEGVKDILNIHNTDDFLTRKGQAILLNRILNFQQSIERAHKEAEEFGL